MTLLKNLFAANPRKWGEGVWDSFIPDELSTDAELLRRSRLQIRFDWMGCIFGLSYALFYLLIGHLWGAGIIILCSMGFALIPGILRQRKSLQLTGHLFAFILLSGFSALCAVEGGLHGHAIAWLSAIPLCVLLLLDLKGALIWSVLCFVMAVVFGMLEVGGTYCVRTYDPKWETVVSFAGYCGLVCFMTLLGVTFERTRARAFEQMQKAMAALSSANQHLTKLNEEKNEFLNIAAHDLKNPICGINGYAELLPFFKTPVQITDASTVIQKQCQKMLEIISNLLDVQRIEDGSIQLNMVRCQVDEILTRIVANYLQRAQAKFIRLLLEGDSSKPAVLADENAMEQILDNLISNAIKYSPKGTTVCCTYTLDRGSVCIGIHDQGPGLSEEDQQNLFKKFSKLGPRPTGGESSNGLGLWIVHRMAQSMHGEVSCQSTVGKGSIFMLTLPLWKDTTAGPSVPAVEPLSEDVPSLRHLLAEAAV